MATTAGLFSMEDLKKSPAYYNAAEKTAFERLPEEIIEQILQLTSPNGFASLILLNRKWRAASQQSNLYAHHLLRCPSYAAAHHNLTSTDVNDSLPRLRRLFAREVKRNLFESYLRPQETIVKVVSTSISSSSAPGGEAFHFSLSPRGHYILAYSSSRIHVINVTGPDVIVQREFKILRRPASTTITDDGRLLAVLSTDLQVDLYDLTSQPPKHTRAVALDHTPRTIALSPTGAVLAAAYDSGVEVSSLDPSCINTDRRAVKCYAVDSLSFSRDGTQLLGTTMHSRNPSTVILTAPYYDPGGSSPEESVSALWTTSILFPNGSRDCSHAVLLPSPSDGEASWTFTYDRVFETFRAVRIDDLRNGTTYFTGPTPESDSGSKLLPSTLPTASESGDLVASGFQSSIWLYGVPEDLDAPPNIKDITTSNSESEVSTPSSLLARRNSAPSLRSINRPRESISRTPQWQLLGDRLRNTFVEGRKVGSLDRVTAMVWVGTPTARERLVAVAPGVGGQPTSSEDDGMSPVDGGRISILDFDYGVRDGRRKIITIEVGMDVPEILEEEHRDLDTEVAIVRRRTVAQRRGNRNHVSRSSTTATRTSPRPEIPPMPIIQDMDPFAPRMPIRRSSQQTTTSTDENVSVDDDQEAFDAPYSHTSPRSGTTLRRAATAAAVNRRLHPQTVAQEHIEYRRADGREEHPHESDADNWVPPPPPYTRDPVPPLPEHIQRSLLAEAAAATLQRSSTHRAPSIDFPGLDSGSLHRSRTVATMASSSTSGSQRERFRFQRSMSDSTNVTSDRVSLEEDEVARPSTSPQGQDFDDLYDVSPPGTPQPTPRRVTPVHQIPRRPVNGRDNPINSPGSVASMHATLIQPLSPIPQVLDEVSDGRLHGWDSSGSESSQSQLPTPSREHPRSLLDNPHRNSHGRPSSALFKAVPPRPNENHHLTELPPPAPALPPPQDVLESRLSSSPRRSETVPISRSAPEEMNVESLTIGKRAVTAPLAPRTFEPSRSPPLGSTVNLPSADQLARLNSRKGRPAGLTDPRRLSGGASTIARPSSGSHSRNSSSGSIQNAPPRLTPEQALGNATTHGANTYASSPQIRGMGYSSPASPFQSIPTRRASNGNSHNRNGSPNLRPPMQRLETIHSQSSFGNSEPSPYFAQKAMMVSRQPSRAERSAAKNIKDAKKRGWRASMRNDKKKDKVGDGASSTGWTDVTRDSNMPKYSAPKEKSGKCAVM